MALVETERDKRNLQFCSCGIFILGFVGGALALSFGVWTLVDRDFMSVILGSDLMTVSAWMLAIFGGLAMVLMVLGDVAICLPHVYVMYTYAILQGIVFLGFIIAAVLALVFQSYVNGNPETLKNDMRDTIYDEYGVELYNSRNRAVTDSWDETQTRLDCCSVDDQSWEVYHDSKWYSLNEPINGIKPYVPESCCVTEPMWNVNYEKCQTFHLGPPAHTDGERNDHLNYRGCFGASRDMADHQSKFLIGTGFLCGFLAIFPCFLYSIYLATKAIPLMRKLDDYEARHQSTMMYPRSSMMHPKSNR